MFNFITVIERNMNYLRDFKFAEKGT